MGRAEPQALRHPRRQRELRRRLRGLLPARRALAGRRARDARGHPRVRGRRQPGAGRPAIPSCRPPPPPPSSPSAASTTTTGSPSPATTCTTRATGRRWTACRSRRSSRPASGWRRRSCPARRPRRRRSSCATLAGAHDGELKAIIEAHQAVDRRPRRRAEPRAPAHPPARGREVKGNNVISGELQTRRRHQLRGADRLFRSPPRCSRPTRRSRRRRSSDS